MDGIWYFRRSGKLTGPIPFPALIEAADQGAFDADDEVRSGHSGWRKARTVPELSAVLGVPVEQSVIESNGTISELENLPNIDDFFNDSDTQDTTAPIQQESPPDGLDPENHYYCRIEGKERGPLTLEELQELVDTGTIQIHERVRQSDSVAWVPCSEIGELDFDRSSKQAVPAPDRDDPEVDDGFDPGLLDRFEDFDPVESMLQGEEGESSPPDELASEITAFSPAVTSSSESPASHRPEISTDANRMPPVPEVQPVRPIDDPYASILEPETKPEKSHGFTLPNMSASTAQLAFLGLAVLFFVYLYAFPSSNSSVYGTVKMGEHSLPVGSVSLNSGTEKKNSAMTISIFDGVFEAGEGTELNPETYEVIVIIGNPLGMQVPQLEGTAFENLNGARYRTQLNGADVASNPIVITISESNVELLKGTGELPDSRAPE